MDIKKLNPWNWFSREESQSRNVPMRLGIAQAYSPLSQLHYDIDRIFDSVIRNFGLPALGTDAALANENMLLRPHVDVASTDKEYTISVEVPGVDEKDVKLELARDGTLTIRGEKKQEKEHKDKDFHRTERFYGAFQRMLSLPEDADEERITASFKNGVLTVTCPRKAATAKEPARRIDIKKAA